ncbi:MAG TPA: 3TM-type holin [Rhodocyclaceae bacterium]|nr:3TM-type holin [Rhodocyclaceae bacterium]
MDPITIAMGLATLVPDVLKWLGHDNAAQSAQKIVSIAQQVTGTSSGEEALAAVRNNPTLALQLQQELDRNKEELAKIGQATELAEIQADSTNIVAVNTTMRSEDGSEHWPTYSWRPFIGFCFGFALLICVLVVAIAYISVMLDPTKAALLDKLPAFLTSMSVLLAIPMPVLGIASYFRGKMQADPDVQSDPRG